MIQKKFKLQQRKYIKQKNSKTNGKSQEQYHSIRKETRKTLTYTDQFRTFAQQARLSDIESSNIDMTRKNQHGFKKARSTITALKEIQSQIATKIDEGYYVAMGSLDLTAAFDVVNIDLLIQRLKNSGLPLDWMELLEAWLRDRAAFVEVSADRSILYDVNIGTVQGSILGPVLFSLFISPILEKKTILWLMQMTPTQSHLPEQKKMQLLN